jgi:hypothetical protein
VRKTAIADRALVRLLSKSHHKPPVLRGLVDTDDEAALLARLEGMTSNRLLAEQGKLLEVDRRELAYRRRQDDLTMYGLSHINAALVYSRPTGNRFNPGTRGAWYCSWESLTSATEVGFHRTRELGYTGVFHDQAQYVELLADFIGEFPDLHHEPNHPALSPDTAVGYPAGQELARTLQTQGAAALIYPSVRHRSGRCLVAFESNVIQSVRPGATWEFTWSGQPDFTMRCL